MAYRSDGAPALLEHADMTRYTALRKQVVADGGTELSGYDWDFVEHFEARHNIKHLGVESSWEDSATKKQ